MTRPPAASLSFLRLLCLPLSSCCLCLRLGYCVPPRACSCRAGLLVLGPCELADRGARVGLPALGRVLLSLLSLLQMDAYTPLRHVMHQLWGLWELLLLGEPLLVAAPTPGESSCWLAA
jgi:hypothetical protein